MGATALWHKLSNGTNTPRGNVRSDARYLHTIERFRRASRPAGMTPEELAAQFVEWREARHAVLGYFSLMARRAEFWKDIVHPQPTSLLSDLTKSDPAVLVGFHSGAYRELIGVLAASRVPLSVLAPPDHDGDQYRDLWPNSDVSIIDNSDPLALVSARNALRAGRNVLAFPDLVINDQGRRLAVSFAGGVTQVRPGVFDLARRTNTTVRPLFLDVEFFEQGFPTAALRSSDLIDPESLSLRDLIQLVMSALETHLLSISRLGEWLGWMVWQNS